MNPLPIAIHPIDNYTFGSKAAKHDKDATVRALRMKEKYCAEGMRRTVECVLLVANHGHPHVLLLQIGGPNDVSFRLPGGRLRPGEGDLEGVLPQALHQACAATRAGRGRTPRALAG